MPIDGVSFSNSGFNINNPSEVNVQAEALASKEAEKKVKETEKSDKPEEDDEEAERDLQGRDTQDGENEEEENDPEKLKNLIEQKKKFLVKFNASTELIEMQDAITGEVIETLTPEDLINLLSKSKAFSGVFVDRKI